MALKNESAGTARLVGILLTPSWFSGLVAFLVGIIVIGGTVLLTRIGSATEQSVLGLHSIYRHSSLGINADDVGQHLGSNSIFNNAILFVLWGSVGLVVYSAVQGIINELNHTDDMLHEMHYVHANRQSILRDAIFRAVTRLAALAGWWILAWAMLHKILPYAIASAHLSAYNLSNIHEWLHTLIGFCLCLLGIHGLVILLRLIILRPRLTGNSIL